MTHKDRLIAALEHRCHDIPALEYFYTDVVFWKHGMKLANLYSRFPGDTTPNGLPKPSPSDFLSDGSYFRQEIGGVGHPVGVPIFGRVGHAAKFLLAHLEQAKDHLFPPHSLQIPMQAGKFAEYKCKYWQIRDSPLKI